MNVQELVDIAKMGEPEATSKGVSRERYEDACKLAITMNNNSIYVHGYDKVRWWFGFLGVEFNVLDDEIFKTTWMI